MRTPIAKKPSRNPRSSFVSAAALTGVGASVLVACGGEGDTVSPPPPPPPPDPVGSYTLATINAVPLPVVVTIDGASIAITASTLNIRAGNTFSMNMSGGDPITGVSVTIGGTGTWAQSDEHLTLRYDSGGCSDLAVIEGRTLRIARDCAYGWELVFQR